MSNAKVTGANKTSFRRSRPSDVDPAKAKLLDALARLYDEVDALFAGWSCDASTDCCRFGVTGREPYPSAVELAMLEQAIRARGGLPKSRSLPMASERRCALLSDDGRCLVYAHRPFGCRTFFCERGSGPGGGTGKGHRAELTRLGRAISDLSARYAPADPGPRPLSRWTQALSPKSK